MVTGANAIFYSDEALTPENPSGAASISWDPDDDYCRPYYNYDNPLNNRFVTYRLYWDENSLRFTVIDDGVEHDLYTDIFPIDSVSQEFQEPFYLISNLAIGGAFTDAYNLGDPGTGAPVSMPFPAEMYVDYIKVMKWNGQGEVNVGPPTPENGTFGIFTDNTATHGKLEAGISSDGIVRRLLEVADPANPDFRTGIGNLLQKITLDGSDRARLARLVLHGVLLERLSGRALSAILHGRAGPEGSLTKLVWSQVEQELLRIETVDDHEGRDLDAPELVRYLGRELALEAPFA